MGSIQVSLLTKYSRSVYDHAFLICLLGVTTSELDNLTAETCAYMNIVHPDYSKLAARIAVSNLHKRTSSDFLEVSKKLKNFQDKQGREAPLLAEDVFNIIERNID